MAFLAILVRILPQLGLPIIPPSYTISISGGLWSHCTPSACVLSWIIEDGGCGSGTFDERQGVTDSKNPTRQCTKRHEVPLWLLYRDVQFNLGIRFSFVSGLPMGQCGFTEQKETLFYGPFEVGARVDLVAHKLILLDYAAYIPFSMSLPSSHSRETSITTLSYLRSLPRIHRGHHKQCWTLACRMANVNF